MGATIFETLRKNDRGQEYCQLTFDWSRVRLYPYLENDISLAQFKVGSSLLIIMENISLSDLVRMTGLPEADVLEQIKFYRQEFGVKGNSKKGYRLSDNNDKRLAMSDAVSSMVCGPR